MVKNKNKKSRFGGNQLKACSSLSERKVNVREEKTSTESSLIQFSLKDLYFQFRSARKESADGHWGRAPSVHQLTL